MSEPKTVPTEANVHDFLDAAATARRRVEGLRLAEIYHEVTGADPVMWGPTMVGYGSFRYISQAHPRTRGDWPKTGFSPRKSQLTFYGLKDLPEALVLLPKLGAYTEGAGCVLSPAGAVSPEPADSHVDSHVGRSRWTRTKLMDVTTGTGRSCRDGPDGTSANVASSFTMYQAKTDRRVTREGTRQGGIHGCVCSWLARVV